MASKIRTVKLPEKDQPLREDVSLLGRLVGETLVDQHGQELLDLVERVRTASIRNREVEHNPEPGRPSGFGDDGLGANELEEALAELDQQDVQKLIHAFSAYLRAVNLAEKVHRIRRRRVYQRADDSPQPGGIEAVLGALKAQGHSAEELDRVLKGLRIHPVFTAHPTEATRRTIQEKEYDIVLRLVERLNPELTPGEERLALRRIRAAITSAWQTRLESHARPTVADELDNILFYLTDILYRVTPAYYDVLAEARSNQVGGSPEDEQGAEILRFGSWVGGDMDGNPNVTAKTFTETLALQRQAIIGRYVAEVEGLARYLSQSTSEITVADAVIQRLDEYRALMPDVAASLPGRYNDMPYRGLLTFVASRLRETRDEGTQAYESVEAFTDDINLIRNSLSDNKGRHAGQFGVDRLLCRVRTFGFHLATLDVRQDALLHRQVLGELLEQPNWVSENPETRAARLAEMLETGAWPEIPGEQSLSDQAREAMAVFRAVRTARLQYGPTAVGMFIISMAQGADDVLTILALDELANRTAKKSLPLEVTPLLETVDDLDAGPTILRQLLGFNIYHRHLEQLGNRQAIMVGYSDSNKDSGIVSSRWALYEAQRSLVATGAELGVEVTFFHGRGGTVSRGGGNLVNGILGAPPQTVNGYLRVTEQGEVINQKYGVRFLALRNLELVTGATLTHTVRKDAAALNEEESEIVGFMARESRAKFRNLVYGDPGFPAFFRAATPLDVIQRLNIGSRPASRRGGEGIENLRAIPWVFSWAQTRIGFPGVFGFGTALEAAVQKFGLDRLQQLLASQVFFQAMVNDVEMVLGKSELGLGRRYASLAGEQGHHYFTTIEDEFQRARKQILELKGIDELLDDQRVLQRNIRLRNPYVDPLHMLQIDLLRRWRAGNREDDGLLEALKGTVKGIALGIQNTG